MACSNCNFAGAVREGPALPVVIKYDYRNNESQPVVLANQEIELLSGTVSAAGDTVIIPSPGAGQQIVITAIQLQNESTNSTLVILKFGSDDKWRILLENQSDIFVLPLSTTYALPVGDNTTISLNLGGANAIGWNIAYYVQPV